MATYCDHPDCPVATFGSLKTIVLSVPASALIVIPQLVKAVDETAAATNWSLQVWGSVIVWVIIWGLTVVNVVHEKVKSVVQLLLLSLGTPGFILGLSHLLGI